MRRGSTWGMASPAQQLETERWRALIATLSELKANVADLKEQVAAGNVHTAHLKTGLDGVATKVTALESNLTNRPLSQLWVAFLVGDWKVKSALILPPVLFVYAFAAGQPIVAVASDILTTARLCATGRPEPIHGP